MVLVCWMCCDIAYCIKQKTMIEYDAVDRWVYNTMFGIQISEANDKIIFHLPLDGECYKIDLSVAIWGHEE